MHYERLEDIIAADGLRLVLVQGFPSPWGQAAKAMMDYKQLIYRVGPQEAGGENAALQAWAGTNSGPVVACNGEPPINRWDDILMLVERLAPARPLLPATAAERVQVLGLAHEICGELGLGWNRRLDMFRPAMESGDPPAAIAAMAAKWGYTSASAAAANDRVVDTLRLLTSVLEAQSARGSEYFVGDGPTAVDFYWVMFSNLVDLMPAELCPLDEALRPLFSNVPDTIRAAVAPLLLAHRERFLRAHCVVPMDL